MGREPPGVSNIVEMIKNSFSVFDGTMGRKVPVETSPARHWAPVLRKANLRDVPPSNLLCGQQCFSVAISLNSTGSAPVAVAIDQVACGAGRDKTSATFF
jgi:hypothetical protein